MMFNLFTLQQNEQEVFKRDFSSPTLEDHFDKTILPKVMQVCLAKLVKSAVELVAEWLGRSLRVWEVGGSIPGRVKPKISKW